MLKIFRNHQLEAQKRLRSPLTTWIQRGVRREKLRTQVNQRDEALYQQAQAQAQRATAEKLKKQTQVQSETQAQAEDQIEEKQKMYTELDAINKTDKQIDEKEELKEAPPTQTVIQQRQY